MPGLFGAALLNVTHHQRQSHRHSETFKLVSLHATTNRKSPRAELQPPRQETPWTAVCSCPCLAEPPMLYPRISMSPSQHKRCIDWYFSPCFLLFPHRLRGFHIPWV